MDDAANRRAAIIRSRKELFFLNAIASLESPRSRLGNGDTDDGMLH
jgi:hypothetical protein